MLKKKIKTGLLQQKNRLPSLIGLDMSVTSTGLTIVGSGIFNVRSIRTKPSKIFDPWDDIKRMNFIVREVMDISIKTGIRTFYCEAPAFGAYDIEGKLSQLRGLFLNTLFSRGYNYPLYIAPTKLKKFITGKGNTPKTLMGEAIRRIFSKESLNVTFTNDDEIDSFGVALFGYSVECIRAGIRKKEDYPKYQQQSMKEFI